MNYLIIKNYADIHTVMVWDQARKNPKILFRDKFFEIIYIIVKVQEIEGFFRDNLTVIKYFLNVYSVFLCQYHNCIHFFYFSCFSPKLLISDPTLLGQNSFFIWLYSPFQFDKWIWVVLYILVYEILSIIWHLK